eukprot:TRINITY_DN7760_c0_g1_i2.p1 TRINITY_DN7760_c0_g1~~TRINITY_DN7760_c0_g1_i2.p1  ORF type:complete len:541 (+),score=83.64 TRINITY_DN7760_c0_g1_i2:69-1625(+)
MGCFGVLALVLIVFSSTEAWAQNDLQVTVYWTCTGNGDWTTAGCWSTGQLPTPNDVVYLSGGPGEVAFFQGGYEPYTTPPNTVKALIIDGNGFVFGVEGMRMLATDVIIVQNGAMIDVGYPTELYSANLTVISNSVFQNDWGTFVSFDLVEIGPDGSRCTFTMDGSLNTSLLNVYPNSGITYKSQFITPFWYPNWVETVVNLGTFLWQNGSEITPKILNNGTMIINPAFVAEVSLPFVSLVTTDMSSLVFQCGACSVTLQGTNFFEGHISVSGANLVLEGDKVEFSGIAAIAPASSLSINTLFVAANGSQISGSVNVMSQGNLEVDFGSVLALQSLSITSGAITGGGTVSIDALSIDGGATVGKNTTLTAIDTANIGGAMDLEEGSLLVFEPSASVSLSCPATWTNNCTITIGSSQAASKIVNYGDLFVNSSNTDNNTSWLSSAQVFSEFTNDGLVYVSFTLEGDYLGALIFSNDYQQQDGSTILQSGLLEFAKQPDIAAGNFPEQCGFDGNEYVCKS